MQTFKARFTVEQEVHVEASDVAAAGHLLRAKLAGVPGVRILGLVPLADAWPDVDLRSRGEPSRGGGSPPPGGTPGTPVIRHDDQPVAAVAA